MNTGLCIGGPLDGKVLSHHDTIYTHHQLAPTPVVPEPDQLDEPPDHRYYFTGSVYWHTDSSREINFWVGPGMTILDAFDALLTRYQEPREERTLMKRAARIIENAMRNFCFREEHEIREVRDVWQEIMEKTDE